MSVLVLNSGSSSLKFGLYAQREGREAVLFKGNAANLGSERGALSIQDGEGKTVFEADVPSRTAADVFAQVAARLRELHPAAPDAIGHRVVHGGPRLREHQALTPDVIQTLESVVHFAPLHLPPALALIHAAREQYPGARQFACFDTAFHTTIPEEAAILPVPLEYRERGVWRYGFHGLSYESIVARLQPRVPERTVVAHLGSGASLAALLHGVSVDTSMGLTPTGGLPMGTRTGDLDPGVLLFLMRTGRLDADALDALVNHDSGLQALSGGTSDMRALTQAAAKGEAPAELALAHFTRAVAKTVGAYAAVLGGLELLVFTGGIGEHSPEVRRRVCAMLGHLGVVLDAQKNEDGHDVLSPPWSRCLVRVLPSEEEERIAHHTRRLMGA